VSASPPVCLLFSPPAPTRTSSLSLHDALPILDAGQAMGDVVAGHATGVEGTHRQLRARLADRLGGHDADRLTDLHLPAGRQRQAVAGAAHAVAGVAGEHRPDADGLDLAAGLHQGLQVLGPDHGPGLELLALVGLHHLAIDLHVVGQHPAVDPGPQVADDVPSLVEDPDRDAAVGAAVGLDHDDLLGHVAESAGELARVGCAQGGVGQALAGAVGGDEVLQHRQALAEVRDDRPGDDVALRVGHQAAHAGDLADLHHVPAGARAHHHVERVELLGLQLPLGGLGDHVGGLGPDLHQL